MTITSFPARNEYTATAGQTVFNYTFKITAADEISVYITPSGQAANDSTDITTAYTVTSGIGDPNGGTITLDSGASAGDAVTLVSSIPYDRTVDYQNSGDFLPDTVNGDNDRQVAQIKQVAETAGRSLVFPQSLQNADSLSLPVPSAGFYLRWKGDLTGLENTGAPGSVIPSEVNGTAADMVANTSLQVGDFVITVGYASEGDGGGNQYEIVPAATGTADGGSYIDLANGLQAKGLFPGGVRNIVQYGAAEGGVSDCLSPIQTLLDLGIEFYVPEGVWAVTGSLVWSHGSKMRGAGNYSGVASTFEAQGTSTIRYIGGAGGNTAVCVLSDEPVGIEPTTTSTRDMQNIGLSDIVIDGNGLAGIGVYMVRAFSNNNLDRITVIKTTAHGFLALTCFNGSVKNWVAYKNEGKGITLGQDVFGWTNSVVDQTHFDSLMALFNGYDDNTASYLDQFDEVTNAGSEWGIGYFGGRGNVFTNAQAFRNGGAGFYVNPMNSPTLFNGGYIELNGRSTGATKSWDIWFRGDASGSSWNVTFDSIHQGSGTPKQESIRLTGTEPSRVEHGPLFNRMGLLADIEADWRNYRLIDCNRNYTVTNTIATGLNKPNHFVESINGDLNNNVIGVATFDATGGAINNLNAEGIIASVSYAALGEYVVNLDYTFATATYGILIQTGLNRFADVSIKTVNAFRIENKEISTLNLTDVNSNITVIVTGRYT